MQELDTILFLEIIQTEGCRYLNEYEIDGVRIQYFLSINGNKRVAVYVSEEFITHTTAKEYLRQLGLDDLIERMFSN